MEVDYSKLDELATSDIFLGLLLYTENSGFNEQNFYHFYDQLRSKTCRSFGIFRTEGRLHSHSLRNLLTFSEMSQAIWTENHEEPKKGSYYHIRESHKAAIKRILIDRKVLPKDEGLLKQLAEDFDSL